MTTNRRFDGESLESLLNKATNPRNREDDWEFIMDFCDRVLAELEGVQIATKLLLYKIRSPQEREALQAITVLEACVKNCGELFQKAIGKSSFIDNIQTLICEQHVKKTSGVVQQNLIRLLYIWSVALPQQTNIKQAYQKLKQQGIVTSDPVCHPGVITTLQPVQPKQDLFSASEDLRKQLEKLLKSKNPHDHKAANLLIKNAVKKDAENMEKDQKNLATLEEVKNNMFLLGEMLNHFQPGLSVQADLDIMKDLYESCSNFRTTLCRNAADITNEKILGDILRANDQVTQVIKRYEQMKQKSSASPSKPEHSTVAVDKEYLTNSASDSKLIDLSGVNSFRTTASKSDSNTAWTKPAASKSQSPTFPAKKDPTTDLKLIDLLGTDTKPATVSSNNADTVVTQPTTSNSQYSTSTAINDADDVLLDLRSSPSTFSNNSTCLLEDNAQPSNTTSASDVFQLLDVGLSHSVPQVTNNHHLHDDFLGLTVNVKSSVSTPNTRSTSTNAIDASGSSLVDWIETAEPYKAPENSFVSTFQHLNVGTDARSSHQDTSLDNVHVPLEAIRPSNFPSPTLFDKDSIRVLIHFAKDRAIPERPDTLVSVISFMSTNTKPVRNVLLQVAVPKAMKVKLQAVSSTELPAFNPMISSPPVTQIMIISNSSKEEVKLRYKLGYNIDMQPAVSHMGIIEGFPNPETWKNL